MNLLEMLRMNLQFFSTPDDGGGSGDPAPTDPTGGNDDPGTGNPEQKPEDKTFTQEDVNNIATKEARKAQEKIFEELGIKDFENAKDGFKKFQKWQEEQKTELEKHQDKLKELSTAKESVSSENQSLKAQLSALKQGVNSEFVEDVVALAERQVSDEVSIDDAIKSVVEKYPHFAGVKEQQSPRIVTPGNPNGGKKTESNAFAAVMAKYKK